MAIPHDRRAAYERIVGIKEPAAPVSEPGKPESWCTRDTCGEEYSHDALSKTDRQLQGAGVMSAFDE
jgi:hypothetical protein